MLAESVDDEEIIARVAALDIGKAELVCCVRVPGAGGGKRRSQEVSTHSTMTRSLGDLANRLVDLRVERVVMEATSDYFGGRCSTCWRPMAFSRGWSTPGPTLADPVPTSDADRAASHAPPKPRQNASTAVVSTACCSSPSRCDTASRTKPSKPNITVAALISSRTWGLPRIVSRPTNREAPGPSPE